MHVRLATGGSHGACVHNHRASKAALCSCAASAALLSFHARQAPETERILLPRQDSLTKVSVGRHDHKDSKASAGPQQLWGYSSIARLMTLGEIATADDSQRKATGHIVQSPHHSQAVQ